MSGLCYDDANISRVETPVNPTEAHVKNWKLLAAKYGNSTTMRVLYVLLALAALALASGAPSNYGP